MTITYLQDRHPKAALESSHPEVASSLRARWSVMMDGGQETVAWVGIARATSSGSIFFLPHGSPTGPDERADFAALLMKGIVRFSKEHSREGEGRDRESTGFPALLADLASDFRDFGLFSTREKLRTRRDGKPDWARTVKSETAFPAANGAPVYCETHAIRYSSMATNLVARIQEQVLAEIQNAHGWWLGTYFGSREIPRPDPLTDWPRENWPNLLRLARRDLYQNRAIRLVGLLLEYLEQTFETGIGEVVCGISDFSTLWEVMLRETIPDVERGWNSRLPRPRYFRSDGSSDPASGMEIDIVARSGNHTLILDAKYYRATSKGFVPGVQDISKQFVYQKAVESTGKVPADRIVNAFVFPAETTGREPFRRIEFILPGGEIAPGFSPVQCQYVSATEVVKAYAERRKLADPAWLSFLANPEEAT